MFFFTEVFENVKLSSNDELELADPFNLDAPDFLPETVSPVLTASVWYEDIPSAVEDDIETNMQVSAYHKNPL